MITNTHWNEYTAQSATVSGGVPIWAELPKRVISGGMIKNTLAKGDIIAAGTPAYLDITTAEVKLLKCYKIKKLTVVDTNTTITLYNLPGLPAPTLGEFVMVPGSTISATGKAAAVTTLDSSVAGELSFTVVTAALDAMTEGGFLCQSSATAAGSTKSLYCQPNTLTLEDTVVGDQNSVGLARGEKYIYKNTMPYAPDVVLNNIPMLEFAYFPKMESTGYAG